MVLKKKHSPTQVLGFKAEKIACDYLIARGLKLITKNFTTRFGEIDLIMEDQNSLVFIEVRQRKASALINSIESIDSRKRKKIIRTAHIYLKKYPSAKPCRLDVIAINTHNTYNDINWIKDAFQVE